MLVKILFFYFIFYNFISVNTNNNFVSFKGGGDNINEIKRRQLLSSDYFNSNSEKRNSIFIKGNVYFLNAHLCII